MTIAALPMYYRGTRFRSTLEADWAATFDTFGWHWQYEPVAVQLCNGRAYLCDFYLPSQRVWCEVKGPHNERIEKVTEFRNMLGFDEWESEHQLLVILRPSGPGETAVWEGVDSSQHILIAKCPECRHLCFMDYNGPWRCRRGCRNGGENKFWRLGDGGLYWPQHLAFTRAPRPERPTKGATD